MYFLIYRCLGADVVIKDKIYVRFVGNRSKFVRAPVAHTCGCVLEIAYDYETYQEFREEYSNILESGIWVMDIV